MPTMLILGANSDIARATALQLAEDGWDLLLAARDEEVTQKNATDIAVRTERHAECVRYDACASPEEQKILWNQVAEKIDGLFCAVGLLGDQEKARHDPTFAQDILTRCFSGLVPMLSFAADTFEQRGHGVIAVISSVAGDRGRASNYTYGSAKAGLSAYLSGLRQRLSEKGIHVLTIKPGFVATSMTEGKKLPPLLTASPERVATDIVTALKNKCPVLYTPWFWRWIMLIIKFLPESLFQKLKKL